MADHARGRSCGLLIIDSRVAHHRLFRFSLRLFFNKLRRITALHYFFFCYFLACSLSGSIHVPFAFDIDLVQIPNNAIYT
jgi:hypothetical protein